jgi:hypothetical protein
MRHGRFCFRVRLAIALAALAPVFFAERAGAAEDAPPKVTAAQVDAAIKKGIAVVRANLRGYRGHNTVGYAAMGVMALLNAGVPANDPVVANAINDIVRNAPVATGSSNSYMGAYVAGVVNMLLEMLHDPQHDKLAAQMTARLRALQEGDGGWGDFSRTQFALMGLKAAEDMGVKVHAQAYQDALRYLKSGQLRDGSFGYKPGGGGNAGYGSMTAAGITSLFIVNEQAMKNSRICGQQPNDAALRLALDWLDGNFTVRGNPRNGGYHSYYLYALERIGVLLSQKHIGKHDWYREGAAYLVAQQKPGGAWGPERLSTEFALLFLGKGRAPIVIQKLRHEGEWNSDPYDVKDVARQASRELGMPMTTQVIDGASTTEDLLAAPILYLQGHSKFTFAPQFRTAIKAYIDQGGFVVASACCGKEGFDAAFRTEMKLMFPDAAFEKVEPEHDIFSIRHKIADPKAFMLEGLNTGCRTAVFYAPHDLCCAWGGCQGCTDKDCLAGEEAKKLGVNLIAYATGFTRLRNKLDEIAVVQVEKDANGEAKRGALVIGQVFHNGEWNPDPGSISNLTRTLKEQFGMKAEVAKRQVVLGADELGDYPILYITGHKKFHFEAAQIDALRKHLDQGGFLLADPCCGRGEFDLALRQLCKDLYPDNPLTAVPAGHSILQEPYLLDKVAYKKSVQVKFPEVGTQPQLESVNAPDGRLKIVYSRFNFGCELQGHACADCLGIAGKDAYRVAVNAVLYALSH